MHSRAPGEGLSREARKRLTRQALLDAALELLEEQGFSALSLRQVARRAGIVPTAFYRHFDGMEDLGLALIDESFRTLRDGIRAARADPRTYEHAIASSVAVLVRYVHEHRTHFRFIARERFGGVAILRQAIRAEIRLFASELATDLARIPPYLSEWTGEDLQLLASLIVSTMVSAVEALLDLAPDDRRGEEEIVATAQRQLRMMIIGVPGWRSAGAHAG